ncbi:MULTISPECIES: response regulator [Sphingomonas]|uniref:Response regulator n=1 Tax=Sphingomonas molluscorum TaxID=418184 RepID=A0ABU8Q4X6_9SPHN|nr:MULTISPECIES: response regulator [unclassified Sphingomonas]MBM7406330.1 DNA-binding response OmpR family regulator [Sphingomonas sp. JUb134]MCG7349168.1 response regulator [Sphingomonas sp. ACRSK]RSV13215.1 response regulator [Sphingomonas sp. ABOLF]GLK22545.1 response regulator [Microbacterium terregens]
MTAPQRILIVEDEPLIAMMLEDFLDILGKSVAGTADCVSDALSRIEEGGIDAAILDVNLRGGEKSWPIADALAAAGIPFVLATGGSGDAVEPTHRDRPVLPKPFTMDGVEKALTELG